METKMETQHYVLTADSHDGLPCTYCGRPRPSQSRRRGAGDRSRAARPDPALYCDRLWPGARDDVSVCADRVRTAK